ncbi:uncharacterized protein LOC123316453 [Coccinella septempunctata]|uniref:uncharacterized protein LOC123316453 n=1 Tax=Coccinella septempunctata TaxID=41139 RepID=UPI001D088559|nr:uncharacterized protein LOC123316453 [Coccinella septempunctata]
MDNVMMIFCSSLWILLWSSCKVLSLEEPQQEIYLHPRNFNPHPYEVDNSRSHSARGPILFPPSPAPETEGSNFIKIDNTRKNQHPVDSHPYPKLVRKHKYRNPGRHQEFENQINPQVAKALEGTAKKVLGRSRLGHDDSSSTEQKNYAFSYKVVDHLTGDDFSHTQSQNERATRGEYRVKLPDGRVQIVSYTADKNGYKADVKYQDVATQPQHGNNGPDKGSRFESYRNTEFNDLADGRYTFDHRGEGERATSAVPIHENRIEDYDYGHRNGKVVYVSSPTPTPSAQDIFGVTQPTYQSFQPTASHQDQLYQSLDYEEALQRNHHHQLQSPHRFQIIPHNKVQIVNQGAPSFSSTTAAPSYLEDSGIILSTPGPHFSSDYPHVFVKSLSGVYSKK